MQEVDSFSDDFKATADFPSFSNIFLVYWGIFLSVFIMLLFYNQLFIVLVWSWWPPASRIVWIRYFNSARWGSLLAVLTWERHTGAADVSSAHPVVLTFDLRFSVNPTDSEPTTTSRSKSLPFTLWCAGWTSAGRVYVSECSELLSCDWLMVLWFFYLLPASFS